MGTAVTDDPHEARDDEAPPERPARPAAPRRGPRPGGPGSRRPPSRRRRPRPSRPRPAPMLVRLCVIVVLPILASTAMALHDGWTPVGDNATIALRAGDVLRGDPPLVGMPSTSNTITDQDLSHPGPMEVWLAAIPYALFGPAGLVLTVALVNAAALVLAVVVGWRRGGPPLAIAVTATGLLLSWSLGTTVIRDPLNSHVGLLPWFALVLLCWDVRLGGWPSLPVAVVAASWVVQAHVAYVPMTVVLALGTLILCVFDHRRRDAAARRRFARGRKPALIWAGTVGLLLSLPMLADQVGGSGNLGKMLTFSGERGQGVAVGGRVIVSALGAPPAWLREINDPFVLLRGPSLLDLVAFAATVGLFSWVYAAARRRSDELASSLLQTGLLTLAGAAIVVIRTPLGGAVLAADPMLLLRPVTAVVSLAIGWGVWQIIAPKAVPELDKPGIHRAATVAGALGAMVLVAVTVFAPAKFGGYGEGLMAPIAELEPQVVDKVEGQPLVQVNANGWAARLYLRHALIEDLERHGIATMTTDDDRVFRRSGDGRTAPTATIWVVTDDGEPTPPEPGAVLVARTDLIEGGGLSRAAVRRDTLRRQLDAAGKVELQDTDRITVADVSREFFRWKTPPPDQDSLPSVWLSVDSFVQLQSNGLVASPEVDDDLVAAIQRDAVGRFFAAEDTEVAVYIRYDRPT